MGTVSEGRFMVVDENGLHKKQVGTLSSGALVVSIGGLINSGGNLPGQVIALCAEPDMGKTTVITQVCKDIQSSRGKTKYIDLNLSAREHVAGRCVKACRDIVHGVAGDHEMLLCLDNVPSLDEDDLLKVVKAIRKLVLSGGNVLIGMVPEAESLIEALPGTIVYRSQDMVLGNSNEGDSDCVWAGRSTPDLTHGIPRLLQAVNLASCGDSQCPSDDPRYLAALADVADHALRPSLIGEERELRLAMIEFGSGNLSDIIESIGEPDPSLVASIARDAPFFGLDRSTGHFACAGLESDEGLRTVLHRIRPIAGKLSRISPLVAGRLVARGDFRRAGVVVLGCSPMERARLILGHPGEFVDAGFRRMVEEAVSVAAEAGESAGIEEARLSLACANGTGTEYGRLQESCLDGRLSLPVRLQVELRDALSAKALEPQSSKGSGQARGGMTRALFMARRGLSLLSELRFNDAYGYLLGAPERTMEPSLASCVLWGEYLLSEGLCGNTPTLDDLTGFEAAIRFATKAEVPLVAQALSTVMPLVSVLVGRSEATEAIESFAQRSALAGLTRIQGICLLAAAVADQRAGLGARAFVRLSQAQAIAEKLNDTHFRAVCRILVCATKSSLGEAVTAEDILASRMPARLSMVARALAAVVESSGSASFDVMGKTKVTSCPSGTTWLVHVLASDYAELSRRFRDVVPRPWVEEAERAATVAGDFGNEPERGPAMIACNDRATGGYQLDVTLLGGFSVSVNGVPINESKLERRRAKSLLGLLAAVPGHRVRRYEAMESVWPELDFHDARQRVYEATSVLRTELTSRLGIEGVNPLVSNRGAGTIGLNPTYIHCDVDDFEELARSVLATSRMRPSDVVGCCARLERMYRGDLFVPQVDGAGMVAERCDEVRRLYADVMTFASQQALGLGHVQTAVHYAQNACAADGLREDAELCLVRSLAAAGRSVEAEVSYRHFTDRIVREMKRPPSRELREAYREAVAGGEESLPQSCVGGEPQAASA